MKTAGRHFGAIFGTLNIVHHAGGGAGMSLAAYARNLTGSYTTPFLLAIANAVLSLACVWLAAPRRLPR